MGDVIKFTRSKRLPPKDGPVIIKIVDGIPLECINLDTATESQVRAYYAKYLPDNKFPWKVNDKIPISCHAWREWTMQTFAALIPKGKKK